MRFSIVRIIISLLVVAFIFLCWISFYDEFGEAPCFHHTTAAFRKKLYDLTFRIHEVLEALQMTHVLCYDSLWGQIRLSALLPWKKSVEMCVLNEEFSSNDEVFLQRTFRNHGLVLKYDSSEGMYTVTDPDIEDSIIYLVMFEMSSVENVLRRIGWKRRVLPSDCEILRTLNCFPPRLLLKPLPLKEFGYYILPVPREGIEIQKYHYPDTWWKGVLPKVKC